MPKTKIKCKVCSLAVSGKYPGIISFVNSKLDQGLGVRHIAKDVIKRYEVGISYSSIYKHRLHRDKGTEPGIVEKAPYEFHVAYGKPIRKSL